MPGQDQFSISTVPSSKNEILRRSVNYHPSVWGDYFLEYTCDIEAFSTGTHEVEKLKEEVRKILKEAQSEPSTQMNLIDALQRLGVAYHFEIEIEEAMKQLHDHFQSFLTDNHDLHIVALCFRLLRQQGYNVSCDVFTKFKDNKGDFKPSLDSDVEGMLSLYEAAHVRIHGEDILEEALTFTTTCLTSMVPTLSDSPLGRQVQHSLEQPLHKAIPRLEARRYISFYQENPKLSHFIIKLAKLDFNLVQSFHRKELSDLSKWWKDLDFTSKLPFARDRLFESYFWAIGNYFEPSYSLARVFLSKAIALTTIIDDIYDVYGTFEELQLFNDAIQRWDATAINQLPEYMKICFRALLDIYDKMEEVMSKQGSSYHVYYAKESMKDLVGAYFVEAKWYNEGHVPKLQEYISNALVSSAYYMITTTGLIGMGKIISKEAFEWVRNVPKSIRSSAFIGRLMDDIVSHKFEQERGHVASAVECYMEEYGVSEQEACDGLNKMVEEAWKDVNEECFTHNTTIPMPLLIRVVNLTRILYVVYQYEDSFTHSSKRMKEHITSMFIDPIDPIDP